ncbi:MAG: hypothetical protein HGB28_03245 [Oscillochloris sp.]|nr:hypothetical protein [Oscillochloris sp.]
MEHPFASVPSSPKTRRLSLIALLAHGYDWVAAPHRRHAIERFMIQIAAWGFIIHLALMALAWMFGGRLVALVGTNWLSAIYTPFVAILFFEVLLLVLAIPESTTRALALQFQIMSLIVIRNAFKGLATLDHLGMLLEDLEAQVRLVLDMAGGVLLFGLVGLFYRVAAWPSAHQQALRVPSPALSRFITRKKAVAFGICLVFLGLIAWTAVQWVVDVWAVLAGQAPALRSSISPTTPIFEALFVVMIVADILLLVLSLQLSDAYQHVFRGAGFVITTILLRVALSAERPAQVGIAVAAVVFGIVVLALYKTWPHDPWEQPAAKDRAQEQV